MGGEWVGGGGGWGAEGVVKQPIGLKEQCFAFSNSHELIQSKREDETAARTLSLVPYAVLLMPLRAKKCILVVHQHRQKAVCKSRLGYQWSSNWCFLIVHECNFHVQVKSGFQLMRGDGRFSQRWSQLISANGCIAEYYLFK